MAHVYVVFFGPLSALVFCLACIWGSPVCCACWASRIGVPRLEACVEKSNQKSRQESELPESTQDPSPPLYAHITHNRLSNQIRGVSHRRITCQRVPTHPPKASVFVGVSVDSSRNIPPRLHVNQSTAWAGLEAIVIMSDALIVINHKYHYGCHIIS